MKSKLDRPVNNRSEKVSNHQQKVIEQYDSAQGWQFYQTVMGDFEFNIHYGIYETPYDRVAKASQNTIELMLDLIRPKVKLLENPRFIDLGSGCGGVAHYLASNYGYQITCVNICPEQNRRNFLRAKALGVEDLITIVEYSFEELPADWTNSFDVVWSEEAMCHAEDKHRVIAEINRILSPGGVCVFTDLMRGEKVATDRETKTFGDRNAVTGLASVSDYIKWSFAEGLKNVSYRDLTSHLGINFQKMIAQIDCFWQQMIDGRVSETYLKEFRQSLVDRLDAFQSGSFAWGCFYMTKAIAVPTKKLQILLRELNLISVLPLPLTQENLGDLGTVFPCEDWEHLQLPVVQWKSSSDRPILANQGMSKSVEGNMIVSWDGDFFSAYNQAIDYRCRDLAYRDPEGNIYLEWFDRHEEGGQAFICPDSQLLYVVAPPIANPIPLDFRAFISDRSQGVMLQPNVWHTNPIPLENRQVTITTRQCELNATVECHLASEHKSWLKIRLLQEVRYFPDQK